MQRIVLVFLLLTGFVSACGPNHPNPQVIRFGNGHAIAISTSTAMNPLFRYQLTTAAEYTVSQWELINNYTLPPTLIIVSDEPIPYNGYLLNGIWLGGADGPTAGTSVNTVEVWAGNHQEMPALFHEFCHRAFFLFDHSDSRWPWWDTNGNACYHHIDEGR